MSEFRKTRLERQLADLEEQRARTEAQLVRLESLPSEPTDPHAVIWFQKSFRNQAKTYTYVAFRTEADEDGNGGFWILSGYATNQKLSWDGLLDRMMQDQAEFPAVWIVANWDELA